MDATKCNAVPSDALPGILDFEGVVTAALWAEVSQLGDDGAVACIGMDQAVVDLVPDLVARGRDVRLFIDRPVAVVPDHVLPRPRRADVALALATAWRMVGRQGAGLPLPAVVRSVGAAGPRVLERRSGDLHRQRWLRDSWGRRQMTPLRGDRRPVLRSDEFYRTLREENCRVVSWPIARVTATGVRTCDGLEHRVTSIVVAR